MHLNNRCSFAKTLVQNTQTTFLNILDSIQISIFHFHNRNVPTYDRFFQARKHQSRYMRVSNYEYKQLQ